MRVTTGQYFTSRYFEGSDRQGREKIAEEFVQVIQKQAPGEYPITYIGDIVYIDLSAWPVEKAFDGSVGEFFKKHNIEVFD